ncbi:hypothetical protein E1B28_005511 [Marasmius oreades]|uniref:Shieldin complex subunit 2 first OB fold domain-containing protein n=1 Tax=Marasmius oreades TaxID=181124 RepID=A0A9P7S3L7_9AGAR|nr:uncharacterized protein E1B28_005511 [Marasmius oreades]KAG7094692.1 hypothetical protein E1B28_005511 [Marasmius oreades]
MTFHVFLGAPTAKELREWPVDSCHGRWEEYQSSDSQTSDEHSFDLSLPLPATLEAASRRISLLYHNAIFQDEGDELDASMDVDVDEETTGYGLEGKTTVITWDATPEKEPGRRNPSRSFINTSILSADTQLKTQETEESSYNYSDTSSIARFPTFHFSLHILTSLSVLCNSGRKGSSKVNMLLAILEVEGPDIIRLKKGADAGKEISIMKMILGEETGCVCKLTAWRETAEVWGGADGAVAAKRGDIVLIQNVTVTYEPTVSPTLTASPYLKSKLEICYRTMPYTPEDRRLRPDLRLGASDAAVRKVGAVVQWFERMAGLR